MSLQIIRYKPALKFELLQIWECAVKASHTFLNDEDFLIIKRDLTNFDFAQFSTYCIASNGTVVGFVSVHLQKIELLFIHPDHAGKRLGKKLVTFVIKHLKVQSVDVNEQNLKACTFYIKAGFVIRERTDRDGFGLPYPLLKLFLPDRHKIKPSIFNQLCFHIGAYKLS